jgi:hypothetical protein
MAGRPGTKYPRIVAIMVILCLAKMSSARNRPQSLPLRAQLTVMPRQEFYVPSSD